MPLEEFGQHVPREHDDEDAERLYYKWEGRCPAGNDCMKKSWRKLKKQFWGYGNWTQVIELVHQHLTSSSYHMMSDKDAHKCIDQFIVSDQPMMQYTETFEEREAYRAWKQDVDSKIDNSEGTGKDVASALRMCTQHGRKKRTTQMLSDAIALVEKSAGDVDGYALLDAVATMADAGDLVERQVVQHQRRRRSAEPSSSSAQKRPKLNITLDPENLSSIGKILVQTKSDAFAMKSVAQNWKETATVLAMNFENQDLLLQRCHDELTRIITEATESRHQREHGGED